MAASGYGSVRYSDDERIVIDLKTKTVTLYFKDFTDIDSESLLQVDYNNIVGDCITWPVIFNRIARLKAEMESLIDEIKFDFDKWEAEQYSNYEKQLTRTVTNSRSTKEEIPTKTQVMSALLQTKEYRVKRFEVINAQKQAAIVGALYEAAKEKSKKLDTVSNKLQPKEFESAIIEGTINSVMIKIDQNNFVDKRK